MDIFSFNPETILSFILTLMRVSIIVFALPFFGAGVIPSTVKASLCIVLALSLWPKLSFPGALLPGGLFQLSLMMAGEFILAIVFNVIINFLFAAVQTGGYLIGFSMGFSMVNAIDPLTGAQDVVTAYFLSQVATITFLSLNGHYFLLGALADSFALVPPGGLILNPSLGADMLKFSGQIFLLALKIAAPILFPMLLVDLALALAGREAPQMNIFTFGFPLKILIGFLFLTMIFTMMSRYVGDYILELAPMYRSIMKAPG
ncbi:MAG: flagellar biosynthetic protein FliR [Desulfovibrionaceae bacterium]|nr:flagellar biosynthetic protein FliR [Desulfovibrionaceae bacterium]MBF0512742.1 flagellar biosynthetic protein FliR [Desulfovibrionaceae bacterium]